MTRVLRTPSGLTFNVPTKWPQAVVDRVVGLDETGWPMALADETPTVHVQRPATAAEVEHFDALPYWTRAFLGENTEGGRWEYVCTGEPTAEEVEAGFRRYEFPLLYFGLTRCCGASFKGLEHGVGCRKCYRAADGNDSPVGNVEPLERAA